MRFNRIVLLFVLVFCVFGSFGDEDDATATTTNSADDQVAKLTKNLISNSRNATNRSSGSASNININNNYDKNKNNNKKSDDDDDEYSQVTVDANSVITSTEIQGATPKFERYTLKLTSKKSADLSTTTTTSSTNNIPTSSSSIELITKESPPSLLPANSYNALTNILPTTSRPRHVANGANEDRDIPLMALLAARRSALPRKEYRTPHRRLVTTARTSPSSTLVEKRSLAKSPANSRSTCERNCTKNFTKRTTASCMRRCATLQRLANATTTVSPPTVRRKTQEKDTNEILLTDESSHGFFVVTKDINDTVNHIQDGVKLSPTSTEKSHRNKYKSNFRSAVTSASSAVSSVEEPELQPYLYFGQKLPPATELKISKLHDGNPKILEISVTKPTERIRNPSRRFNPSRTNNLNTRRFISAVNFTRTGSTLAAVTTTTDASKKRNSASTEKLLAESLAALPGAQTVQEPMAIARRIELIEKSTPTVTTLAPVEANSSAVPLLINVPEEEDTTELPTNRPSLLAAVPPQAISNFYAHLEEKPNLIIFVNETKPKTSQAPKTQTVSTTTGATSTTVSTTPVASTEAVASTAKPPPSSPTTTTTTTTSPKSTTTLIIDSTSASTPTNIKVSETTATTQKSFTRTTVSSSVRSTVYPRVNTTTSSSSSTSSSTIATTTTTTTTSSSDSNSDMNFTSLYQPEEENELVQKPIASVPNQGIILENSGVTIEAHRINIATYVLVGLGMLPIIVFLLYVSKNIFKRRTKVGNDLDGYVTDQQPISPVHQLDITDDDHNDDYSILSDNDFERKNLRFKSLLGEGNFGQVWKAEADDLSGHLGTTRIVAVKTVRAGSSQVGLREEADIMKKLGSHTNVVTLLGACVDNEPHFLIMEYAMRGRLLSLLRAARSATNILPASVPGGRSLAPLSPRTLAGFALDISRGMEYISEKKIVHRDLAARNVLLDHNGVCKICDFGMSIDLEAIRKTQRPTRKADIIRHHSNGLENRFKFDFGGRLMNNWHHGFTNHNNNNNNNTNNNNNNINNEKKHHDTIGKRPALPIRWMAPEALQYHIFSTETDVWAFGIVLWEIATLGCTPYPNLSGRDVVRSVPNGARPELPKDGRAEFGDLMTRCWLKSPQNRPTFREARGEIARSICKWVDDDTATSDYMDVSGFSEDLEHGMVYFNRRISEFECEI